MRQLSRAIDSIQKDLNRYPAKVKQDVFSIFTFSKYLDSGYTRPDIILTKNAILQKLKSFLAEVEVKQLNILKDYSAQLPQEVLSTSPKISRGENYKGLPWLVLDNPRHFRHNNIFAIRTMFWWGNFFSITLHLSGNNKSDLLKKIFENLSLLKENDFYVYAGQDEWEHDLDPASYKKLFALSTEDLDAIVSANNFLKLAIKFPIDSLEAIEDKLLRNYELLVRCCCQLLPNR